MSHDTAPAPVDDGPRPIETRAVEIAAASLPSILWAVLWIAAAVYATTGIVAPVLILSLAALYSRGDA